MRCSTRQGTNSTRPSPYQPPLPLCSWRWHYRSVAGAGTGATPPARQPGATQTIRHHCPFCRRLPHKLAAPRSHHLCPAVFTMADEQPDPQAELRRQIVAIMRDDTLTEEQKSVKRQELMSGAWAKPATQKDAQSEQDSARSGWTGLSAVRAAQPSPCQATGCRHITFNRHCRPLVRNLHARPQRRLLPRGRSTHWQTRSSAASAWICATGPSR